MQEPTADDIRTIGVKILALSYLFESGGDRDGVRGDERECYYGISLILNGIYEEILAFSRAMEKAE